MKIYNKEKWEKVKLGEIFELQMGKTPSRNKENYWRHGENSWISISDMKNEEKYICDTKEKITDLAVEESKIKVIPKDTVIMSFKLSIGKLAITSKDMFTNEAIMAFFPKDKVEIDNNYLFYSLKKANWTEGTNKAVKGLTLNKPLIASKEIFLPNIQIQKEIAKRLDKVMEILKAKRKMLLQLNELSKSIFICTFGDLSINNKNFEMKKIKEIAEIFIGVTYQPQDVVDLEEKGIVVLRSGNIQNFMLDFKDRLKIKKDIREKFFVRNKDILMCSRNGSSNLVGKVAIIDNLTEKMTFGAFMTIIRSEYYTYLYNYFKSSYFKKSKIFRKTTTINQITKIELENLIIPIPNIELQNNFARKIKGIEKSKVRFFRGVA